MSIFRNKGAKGPGQLRRPTVPGFDGLLPCVPLYGGTVYKFNIGQTVFLERSLAVPGGTCVITKRLPERDGEFEYRIPYRFWW